MEIGGVERSLLGLLNAIDYSQYEVDLFLCRHEGDFMKMLPEKVNLLPKIKAYGLFQKPLVEVIKQRAIHLGLVKMTSKLRVKIKALIGKKVEDSLLTYYCKASLLGLPKISETEYDLAISFLAPHYFTRQKVKAKQYAAWIHTDYSALNLDKKIELRMWQQYDYIAGVSEQCLEAFKKVFPELSSKLLEIENILSPNFVRLQSEADVLNEMPDEIGNTKLCSVGRFSTAKAFDNAVKICSWLIKNGCQVKWYVIGYGGDEALIRQLIKEYHMEAYFIILGKKMNPYPYMKHCDLYVQPSRYEGKAVAVREAQILGKIPIITNFETAASQVENGVDGVIIPMEIELAAKGIQQVIENKAMQHVLKDNILSRDYGNEAEVHKIYKLIEGEIRPLKVLHCVGKMNCGGAETMLMNIYRHIDKSKLQFDFLVHQEGDGYYDVEIKKQGGKIYFIPSQGNLGIVGYVKALCHFLKEQGPFDVVHSHMDWQGGLIALAARLAGVKRVIVHAHTTKLMNNKIMYKILLRLQKLCIATFATDYWACSKTAGRFLFYKGLCRKERIKVIPNAIDLECYKSLKQDQLKEKLGISQDTLLIGHVGSLSPIKNQLFLVNLAIKLKEVGIDFKLLLVGTGGQSYEQQIIEVIKENELEEKVILLGRRKDIPDIMGALDLFVMPSLFEGLGIAVVEAQAAGTPCLVSEQVPKEVDMGLELVRWLSINEIDTWVKAIKAHKASYKVKEEDCQKALTRQGYNIIESVKNIEALYLQETEYKGVTTCENQCNHSYL